MPQPLSAEPLSPLTYARPLRIPDNDVLPFADHDPASEFDHNKSVLTRPLPDIFPSSPAASAISVDALDEFDKLDMAFEFHTAPHSLNAIVPAPSEAIRPSPRPSSSSVSFAVTPMPVRASGDPPTHTDPDSHDSEATRLSRLTMTSCREIASLPGPTTLPRDPGTNETSLPTVPVTPKASPDARTSTVFAGTLDESDGSASDLLEPTPSSVPASDRPVSLLSNLPSLPTSSAVAVAHNKVERDPPSDEVNLLSERTSQREPTATLVEALDELTNLDAGFARPAPPLSSPPSSPASSSAAATQDNDDQEPSSDEMNPLSEKTSPPQPPVISCNETTSQSGLMPTPRDPETSQPSSTTPPTPETTKRDHTRPLGHELRPTVAPILETADPSHIERRKRASSILSRPLATVRSPGASLLTSIVPFLVAVGLLASMIASWILGTSSTSISAACHSWSPHPVSVYRRAHALIGEAIQISRLGFGLRCLSTWSQVDLNFWCSAAPFHVVRPLDHLLLAITLVLSSSAVASWTPGVISQVSDAISATLAISRSRILHSLTIYRMAPAVTGVIIRASRERLRILSKSTASTNPLLLLVFSFLSSRLHCCLANASNHILRSSQARFKSSLDIRSNAGPYNVVLPPDWMPSVSKLIATAFDQSARCFSSAGWFHRHHGEVGVSFWRSWESSLAVSYLQCPGSSVFVATRDGCSLFVPGRCHASISRRMRLRAFHRTLWDYGPCVPHHLRLYFYLLSACLTAHPLDHPVCRNFLIGNMAFSRFVVAGV